jgi:hypothetical protein
VITPNYPFWGDNPGPRCAPDALEKGGGDFGLITLAYKLSEMLSVFGCAELTMTGGVKTSSACMLASISWCQRVADCQIK